MVPVSTPVDDLKVWPQRVGSKPSVEVLFLYGESGATREYFEIAEKYFPGEGIEFYYYDQLESVGSAPPNDQRLWTVARYVDEVDQIQKALGLNQDDFDLFGLSWYRPSSSAGSTTRWTRRTKRGWSRGGTTRVYGGCFLARLPNIASCDRARKCWKRTFCARKRTPTVSVRIP